MADSTLFSGQQFLNNLQASDHRRKQRFVILGSAFFVFLVVAIWFSSPFFLKGGTAEAEGMVEPDFSLWQTVKTGSMLMTRNLTDGVRGLRNPFAVAEKNYIITPSTTQ